MINNLKLWNRFNNRTSSFYKARLYHPLQRGAASVEYVVVTLMVIVALFVPLTGPGSLSGVGLLLQGLRNLQLHTTYLLSLP